MNNLKVNENSYINSHSLDVSNILSSMKDIGNINIMVVGPSGTGKSTLINSVFRDNLARTGTGYPVTKNIEKIKKDGYPLTIIDTVGFERDRYQEILENLEKYIANCQNSSDHNEHIHLAWICISATSARIEKSEEKIAKFLKNNNIKSIIVLTKSPTEEDSPIKEDANKCFSCISSGIISVDSIPSKIQIKKGVTVTKEPFGINELISESFKLIPDELNVAFSNALSVKNHAALEIKKETANNTIKISAASASAAALTPIPLSDAITIVPIQTAMIVRISVIYGLDISTGLISSIIASVIGGSAATISGRLLVSNALKFIPGIGSALGGMLSAATAGTLTFTIGTSYSEILYRLYKESTNGDVNFNEAVRELKKKFE